MKSIKAIKKMILSNIKVVENYFFMTLLQVLNSFFYVLIYPYLIDVFGADTYGVFVFATSVAIYFTFVVNFGFSMPGVRAVAENTKNKQKLEDILSCIFTAKNYLFLASSFVFSVLLFTIPLFREYKLVFLSCFLLIYSQVLFPQWFFQGTQKMRMVTYIQLGTKLLSLPLIFTLVKHKEDLSIYAIIVSANALLGALVAFGILYWQYKLRIRWVKVNRLRVWFKRGTPFFYSHLAGSLKEYSIPIIIGTFFGMREVAIYDLANKIILIPRTLFMNINAAIFPKLIVSLRKSLVKKIIKIEAVMSSVVMILIIIFGKWIVELVGGKDMVDAYYLSILLSVTILTWMVVGAYVYFVFIPNNKYYLISQNQLIALISFSIFSFAGIVTYQHILAFGGALAISGLLEIVFCKIVSKEYRLI